MIPILYSAEETEFTTNGLGALSDVQSCNVTEETNGQYVLEMEYPVNGKHYSDIALDTIIYAQPADGKDPQPFQIYKISLPINDVVTISANHISYRLSYIPVSPITETGASATLAALKKASLEDNPFTFETTIEDNQSKYSKLVPASFRDCIGGSDESFLDIFGGEVEWDKFTVKIHANRGSTNNNVRITYSKNLTDYKREETNNELVTAIYPYWIDSETAELVTCGIVHAVKDFGYSAIPSQSTPPEWAANAYYRIKTTGYYKNDFDYAEYWIANTYYAVKQDGYYGVEGDSAPIWEQNKYYSVLPYGYFNVVGVAAAAWEINKYYKNVGTSSEPSFVLLTEKPSDWDNASPPNYTNYYFYYGFYKLNSETAPEWTYGIYYKNTATESGKWNMELLVNEPEDWSTNWTSYFKYLSPENAIEAPTGSHAYENVPSINAPEWAYDTYYSNEGDSYVQLLDRMLLTWKPDTYYEREGTEGSYVYTLTTEEPDDWETSYTTYFIKDGSEYIQVSVRIRPAWEVNTYFKKEGTEGNYTYTLTTEKPNDWDAAYTGYFVKDDSAFELQTSKPSDWDENYTQYYTYKEPSYVLTTSQPANWSTNYRSYFVYYTKDESNPIYILTTSEPEDWYDNFNEYYTHYQQVEGTIDYTVLLSEPSDWDENYTNYYKYWETFYSEDYSYDRTIPVDFSSEIQYKPTIRLLRRLAKDYIEASNNYVTSKSLDISFVALWQTEEYKNIAPLERVNLCDTVIVDYNENGTIVSHTLKVVQTVYDVLAERYTSIKLGDSQSSLSNTISSLSSEIKETVSETESSLEFAIAKLGELLNGGLGGNLKINYNGKGRPCEVIFGNSDDIAKMTQCLRINYKGIAFSKDGYNGPYTSIWGLNGEFDAQCIKAGTIDGNSIKANTIQASSISSAAKESILSDANSKISKIERTIDDIPTGWLHVKNGKLYIGDENSKIVLVEKNDRVSFVNVDGDSTPEYDSTETYAVGDRVKYGDYVYACIVAVTAPEEWDSSKWVVVDSIVLAYISNNRFYTPAMTVDNEIDIGNYRITASETGIAFNWIGGSD